MIISMGVADLKNCASACSSRRPVPPSHRSFTAAGRGTALLIAAVSFLCFGFAVALYFARTMQERPWAMRQASDQRPYGHDSLCFP